MNRFAFATAIVSMCASGAVSFAGHHHGNPCACSGQVVTQAGPVSEQNPPTAPQQGQTVMNRSVEPQAAPVMAQPVMNNNYYSGSYNSNSYNSSVYPYSRVRLNEIRHQHARAHFYSMDH